jgi:uncharacterized protein YecT (DUF1311 family)/nitrogen fixation protein
MGIVALLRRGLTYMAQAQTGNNAMIRAFHFAFAAAALFATAAQAGDALPIAKHTLTDKSADYDISLAYPQTGVKTIDANLLQSVRSYAANFRRESKDAHEDGHGAYTLDGTYTIVRNDAGAFVVKFDNEWDMHGAHPNEDLWTANYLRPDGWRVYLPELFDSTRALPKISALAIADLDRRIATGPDAMSDKDWVARGAGPLGTNFAVFALMPGELAIWFPPYAVASFADGPQETHIPLAALRDTMRANPRAPAASFDCARAQSGIEHAVCSDVALARLDRAVAEKYALQLSEDTDQPARTAHQTLERAWLARRNTACQGEAGAALTACLTGVYRERVGALVAPN